MNDPTSRSTRGHSADHDSRNLHMGASKRWHRAEIIGTMPAWARRGNETAADALLARISWGQRHRRPAAPFAVSLCLHALAVVALVTVDLPSGQPGVRILNAQELIADENYRLTWQPLARELPPIAPVTAPQTQAGQKLKASDRTEKQTIVASHPQPDSRRQMIWGDLPDIQLQQDIPSPNLLGWKPPDVRRPRFELTAADRTNPAREAVPQEAAPELAAADRQQLDLTLIQRMAPLRYRAAEQKRQAPAEAAVQAEPAPRLALLAESTPTPLPPEQIRLRYWTRQQEKQAPRRTALNTAAGSDAPNVSLHSAAPAPIEPLQAAPRLRYRPWTNAPAAAQPGRRSLASVSDAPVSAIEDVTASGSGIAGSVAGAIGSDAGAALAHVPAPASGFPGSGNGAGDAAGAGNDVPGGAANPGLPNVAVVGLDPDPNAPANLPPGQRRGRFAASPDGGDGGTASGSDGSGDGGGNPGKMAAVRVPYLSVSGATAPHLAVARPTIPRPSRPGSPARSDLDLFTRPQDAADYRLPLPGDVGQLPTVDPEQFFIDRRSYTLAVDMPSITSGSGSWIIRFAERPSGESSEHAGGPLSAPAPFLKVDPRYDTAAKEEGVEGKVLLYAVIGQDGRVAGIRVMKSLDDRLDQSAVLALSKWRFQPAINSAGPVDVEALIEVPFHLPILENASR